MADILTLNEASTWASEYLNRKVTKPNISYLIQYGKVRKISNNDTVFISENEFNLGGSV